jgi:tetratricopeptide (TPR) repeat protein
MKIRIIHILILLMVCSGAFSQKKEISAARDWVKKGKDLKKAEQSMQNLLKDSANHRNTKIWGVLFESLRKQYEQGNEKLYLNQKYDTASLFNIASHMFTVMVTYDSIDVLPDKKGRVKIEYRKTNSALLNTLRPNLYNGGLFFIRKQKYEEAYTLFNQYLNTASQPLFQSYQYAEKDKTLPTASYWAMYCGYKMKDTTKVMRHAPLAMMDMVHHEMVMQYLSETYLQMGDTTNYVKMLKEGFELYPTTPFFYSHLVDYYSQERQWDKALELTNNALKADSSKLVYHVTKSSLLLNLGKYKESFAISDSLLQVNDSLPEAYLNAGLAKFNEGVTLNKTVHQSAKRKNEILQYYREAMPYLETYRKMREDRIDNWGLPLYTIYLNLNMGKQFDEIDKLMTK